MNSELRSGQSKFGLTFIQSDTSIWQQQKPEKSLENDIKNSLKVRVIGGSKTD